MQLIVISLALLRSLTSAYNRRFRVKPGMRKDGSERGRAGWDEMISALINTKTIWIVWALVFGVLVFVLGCMMGGDTMQYVGAGFLFVGVMTMAKLDYLIDTLRVERCYF